MGARKANEPRGKKRPAGAVGASGRQGTRGATGPVGRQGPRGRAGAIGKPGADHRKLIEVLDSEVHGIYGELSAHMDHLTQIQRQLDEMRKAIRKLGASITN